MTRGRDLEAELEEQEIYYPSVVMIELTDEACERIKAEKHRFTIQCASKVQGLYLINEKALVNGRPTFHQSPNLEDPAVIFYTEDGWLISYKSFESRVPADDNEIWGLVQKFSKHCSQLFDELCIPWWKNEPEAGALIHTRQRILPHVMDLWRLKDDSEKNTSQKAASKPKTPRNSIAAASHSSKTAPATRRLESRSRSRSARRRRPSVSRSASPLMDDQRDHGGSSSLGPRAPAFPPGSRAQSGGKLRGGWMRKCSLLVKAIWEEHPWEQIKALPDAFYYNGSPEFQNLCNTDG